ncbi:CAAX prenyl protease 1 homolog [Drosophila busckii]|uniref:CAAX prenyl protease 1 homolog n=1 Tax=Drosophila busckii TaxID=30019 RepID=UPI00083F43A1|nr:CAAX prenyl protease 1 homolog [Drosophila busckii]
MVGSYSLYQDPMQIKQPDIPNNGIGWQLLPKTYKLNDPVLLRHVLCGMIILHNFFHVCLCWRQLRLCSRSQNPPQIMQNVMSDAQFKTAKDSEMMNVELKLIGLIVDAIMSCIELYFCVFPWLWLQTMHWYSIIEDFMWHNMAFAVLLSIYLVLRGLPLIFYNKIMVEPYYSSESKRTSMPLVGVLCTQAFFIVFMQVPLIPITIIFLLIETYGGEYYFVLWIWLFLLILSLIAIVTVTFFGAPCIGKVTKLPAGALQDALRPTLQEFNFPLDCVYIFNTYAVSNGSVYAWNLCGRKCIVIFDSLVLNFGKPMSELFEEDVGHGLQQEQLVAFIAHELCHQRHLHLTKIFCMLQTTLLIYMLLFGFFYRQLVIYEAAGFSLSHYPHIVGYWLVYKYVMTPYRTLTYWIILFAVRRFEYSADKMASQRGYGRALISALLKLFADNCTFPFVDACYMMWHLRLPTSLIRIRRLIRLQPINSSDAA